MNTPSQRTTSINLRPARSFVRLGVLFLAAMGACTAPSPEKAPAHVELRSDVDRDGAIRVVTSDSERIWNSSQLNELPVATIPWTHHTESHRFRGVDINELCGASIARRASQDAARETWSRIVVAVGQDGYATLFSAAELRADWGPTRAYVCWEQDGTPLPAGDGPLRLIVPTDGGGARCVRGLQELRVIDARPLMPPASSTRVH